MSVNTSAPTKPHGTSRSSAAGPGDPGLLTVRAAGCCASADVVVADADCRPTWPAAVRRADAESSWPPSTRTACRRPRRRAPGHRRRRPGGRRSVVRLLAGDPVLDGALAAEAAALTKAGVHFDIAPGVSHASPASRPTPASRSPAAGRREVRVVDAARPEVDWALHCRPARHPRGARRRRPRGRGRRALLAAGRATGAPRWRSPATAPRSTSARSLDTLGDVAGRGQGRQAGRPRRCSSSARPWRQRAELSWFETKPLFGWRVLVPRTKEQAGALSDQLRALRRGARRGADHLGRAPAHAAADGARHPRPGLRPLPVGRVHLGQRRARGAGEVRGVRPGRPRLRRPQGRRRRRADRRGPAIAFGVVPDLVPSGDQSSSRACWRTGPSTTPVFDPINRVFLPRADIATETLVAGLTELGWEVDDVTAYRTVRAAPPAAETREAIKTGGFDAVLFTSSSTVRNLVGIAGKPHATTVVACIGPQTAKTAEEHGLRVDVLRREPERGGAGRGAGRARRGAAPPRRSSTASRPGVRADAGAAAPAGPPEVVERHPSWASPQTRPRRLRRTAGAAPAGRRDPPAPGRAGAAAVRARGARARRRRSPRCPASCSTRPRPLRRAAVARPPRPGSAGSCSSASRRRATPTGSGATDPTGILNVAVRDVVGRGRRRLVVMADLCLDEFTDHGHCGVLDADGEVDNDATLAALRRRWRWPWPTRAPTWWAPAG